MSGVYFYNNIVINYSNIPKIILKLNIILRTEIYKGKFYL